MLTRGNLHTVNRLTFWMQECSSFLAGDALRSRTRFKALDETGVMGTICRHETPIRFFNLHHGERFCDGMSMHHSHSYRLQIIVGFMYRIGYAVFMLEKLHQHFPNHSIQLMYDIACSLEKHLKVRWERRYVWLKKCVLFHYAIDTGKWPEWPYWFIWISNPHIPCLWTQNGVSGALSLIEVYIGLSVDYKPLLINSSDCTKSP